MLKNPVSIQICTDFTKNGVILLYGLNTRNRLFLLSLFFLFFSLLFPRFCTLSSLIYFGPLRDPMYVCIFVCPCMSVITCGLKVGDDAGLSESRFALVALVSLVQLLKNCSCHCVAAPLLHAFS